MSDRIRASFRDQADACDGLGSPLTARVLRLLADRLQDGPVAERVLPWTGDPSSRADALALRLAAGLHALVLSGADAGLAAAYANPGAPGFDAAVLAAVAGHPDVLLRWLNSPPQTNEVRRSAILIAAGHGLAARLGLPFVLSELGASAGLNLWWDRHALTAQGVLCGPADAAVRLTPEWRGTAPVACQPVVTARAGVDLRPLDPRADRLRLMSYIWPDQADRLARTAAAADLAAGQPGCVTQGDAVDWLEQRLSTRHTGHLHLVFHTVAWQYFPAAAQARGAALLAAAGRRATSDAPLARLGMEADGDANGAAVTLTIWPGGQPRQIARVDFHGRWVDWLGLA